MYQMIARIKGRRAEAHLFGPSEVCDVTIYRRHHLPRNYSTRGLWNHKPMTQSSANRLMRLAGKESK